MTPLLLAARQNPNDFFYSIFFFGGGGYPITILDKAHVSKTTVNLLVHLHLTFGKISIRINNEL